MRTAELRMFMPFGATTQSGLPSLIRQILSAIGPDLRFLTLAIVCMKV